MKMFTYAFNDKRELTEFVNEKGISKEQIVNIYPEEDGMVVLHYYGEE